jgi:hypothetical protein
MFSFKSLFYASVAIFSLAKVTQTHAQNTLLPLRLQDIRLVSVRGEVAKYWIGGISDASERRKKWLVPTPATPVIIKPGWRHYVYFHSHAILHIPDAGACMIVGKDTSFHLPDETEKRVTFGFDGHPVDDAKAFFNIDASAMARHTGKTFKIKTKDQPNSSGGSVGYAQVIISSVGARFFINDAQYWTDIKGRQPSYGIGCTVGVFDGSVQVEELVTKQSFDLQPGMVVSIRPDGITPPRAPTKVEMSYDIGCKLAAMGQAVPGRLPEHLRPKPKPVFGAKTNSLGMIFAPLPDTRASMCIHETRHSDFAAFVAAEPSNPNAHDFAGADAFWGWEDHPVKVQWDKAVAFCEWLSRKEGKKYRLPTDREWSIAAGLGQREKPKAGDTPKMLSSKPSTLYPWGTDWPPHGFENLADLSRDSDTPRLADEPNEIPPFDDGYSLSAPVMSYKPNKLGFYDLGGNVSEWCDDWYDETRQGKVIRGGDFDTFSQYLLKSNMRLSRPSTTPQGFRVVLELP